MNTDIILLIKAATKALPLVAALLQLIREAIKQIADPDEPNDKIAALPDAIEKAAADLKRSAQPIREHLERNNK